MHGLVLRAFQSFAADAFGPVVWQDVLLRANLREAVGPEGFDPLLSYPEDVAPNVLRAAVEATGRPPDQLLEDLGIWLVSNPGSDRLRRLLRFGGLTYADFLRSLDDLQGRARLAVPDLDLPALSVAPTGVAGEAGRFVLTCHACPAGLSQVLLGLLRTLADDYGALVMIEPVGPPAGPIDLRHRRSECLAIDVCDPEFQAARAFALAEPGGRDA